jgi:hypothetical protein
MTVRMSGKWLLRVLLLSSFLLADGASFCAFAGDDVEIEGLHLEKIAKGKKIYSIEAKRAFLGNKRIGFFNTAMIKVFNLEEVNLTIYQDNHILSMRHFKKAIFEINTKRLLDEAGKVIFSE